MTTDPDRALDRRIAEELLGWRIAQRAPAWKSLVDPAGQTVGYWNLTPDATDDAVWERCLPAFSLVPDAAVLVLAALTAREYEWDIEWTPSFTTRGYVAVGTGAQFRVARQFSTWAEFPRALCEAVLAAMGETP